jgi:hypothetical protein
VQTKVRCELQHEFRRQATVIFELLKYSRHFYRRKTSTNRSPAVGRLKELWEHDPTKTVSPRPKSGSEASGAAGVVQYRALSAWEGLAKLSDDVNIGSSTDSEPVCISEIKVTPGAAAGFIASRLTTVRKPAFAGEVAAEVALQSAPRVATAKVGFCRVVCLQDPCRTASQSNCIPLWPQHWPCYVSPIRQLTHPQSRCAGSLMRGHITLPMLVPKRYALALRNCSARILQTHSPAEPKAAPADDELIADEGAARMRPAAAIKRPAAAIKRPAAAQRKEVADAAAEAAAEAEATEGEAEGAVARAGGAAASKGADLAEPEDLRRSYTTFSIKWSVQKGRISFVRFCRIELTLGDIRCGFIAFPRSSPIKKCTQHLVLALVSGADLCVQCVPLFETGPVGEVSGPEYGPFAMGSLYTPYSLLKGCRGINIFSWSTRKWQGRRRELGLCRYSSPRSSRLGPSRRSTSLENGVSCVLHLNQLD